MRKKKNHAFCQSRVCQFVCGGKIDIGVFLNHSQKNIAIVINRLLIKIVNFENHTLHLLQRVIVSVNQVHKKIVNFANCSLKNIANFVNRLLLKIANIVNYSRQKNLEFFQSVTAKNHRFRQSTVEKKFNRVFLLSIAENIMDFTCKNYNEICSPVAESYQDIL